MTPNDQGKLKRAKERVRSIKRFHQHFAVFIIVSILMILARIILHVVFMDKGTDIDFNFNSWLNWNLVIIIFIWAMVVGIHGLYSYKIKPAFLKDWEEKKIREVIEKEFDS